LKNFFFNGGRTFLFAIYYSGGNNPKKSPEKEIGLKPGFFAN